MVVLGTVIATRRLELPGSRTLTLRIGMPRPSSDVDWCCPYELVEEPGGRLVEALEVFGIDALQAL